MSRIPPWHGLVLVGALAFLFAIGWWQWWTDRQRNEASLYRDRRASCVRRAELSLRRHPVSPEGTCDHCTAQLGQVVTWPCEAVRIARAVRQRYQDSAGADPRRTEGQNEC